MKRYVLNLSVIAATAVIAAGAAGAPVKGSTQPAPPADLAITVKPNAKHPRAHHRVYLRITISNLGPGSDTGFTVTLRTRAGLLTPRVVERPPDSVRDCPTSPAGGACHTHWIPPSCRHSRTRVSCRYRSLELTPPGGPSDSVTLVVKAHTGDPGRELAVATVTGANDPNAANNRATAAVTIGRHHRRS